MIKTTLSTFFDENKWEARQHLDRFYPNQSSSFIDHGSYKRLEGKCLRAAYYHCVGVKEDDTSTLAQNLIGKLGLYTEQMLLDIFKRDGRLVESGTKFLNEKYNISGKIDAIVTIDKKEVGIEIKSIGGNNQYVVNQIFGSRWNSPFPKWQNLLQTIVYCYEFKDRIDEFILFYIRRDTCEIKEFSISLHPKDGKLYVAIDGKLDNRFCVEDILERYHQLSEYVNLGILPPRDYQKVYPKELVPKLEKVGFLSKYMVKKYAEQPFGDIACKYCGYANYCDQNENISREKIDEIPNS